MLKLAYRNFIQNKLRSMAVIITIALAAVIIFISLIYQHTVVQEFLTAQSVEAENAEISIEYSAESNSRIITDSPLSPLSEQIDFAVGVLDLYGTSLVNDKVEYINLRGITEEGLDKINNIKYLETIGRELRSDEIIIDKSTSDALNLQIDDSIKITVGSITKTFYVAKIAEDRLCFETDGAYVIYCMENFASMYLGSRLGKLYNKIYIKTVPDTDIHSFIGELSAITEYENYDIGLSHDTAALTENANDIALPIAVALDCCVVLAMYLIFLIINASLKRKVLFISRLKSIGASQKYVSGVFLTESFLYVVAGLIVGITGIILILKTDIAQLLNIDSTDTFYYNQLLISLVICGASAFLCTTLPVIQTRNVSVRSAFASSKDTQWKNNIGMPILASLMIITAVILVIPHYLNAIRGIIAFILGFIGILIILPYIARGISHFVKSSLNDGTVYMAVHNFGRERTSSANMRIMFAGIIICSIIASAAMLTENMSDSVFDDVDCDIIIKNVQGETNAQLTKIRQTQDIYDVYAFSLKESTITINDKELDLHLVGLNPEELELMGNIEYITPENELLEGMNTGLTLNYLYHKIYKINIGDTVTLKVGDTAKEVVITAFYNSYQYGGRNAIISSNLLSELFDLPLYDTIICKTDTDIDTAVAMLRSTNGATNLIVLNKASVYATYEKILDNIVTLADWFALIIILVCFISVITNIINSREEMKTAKYQMYSIGFTKIRIMLVEVLEYLFAGLLTFALSMLSVALINGAITNILALSDFYFENVLSYQTIAITGGAFLLSTLLISLTSYFSVDKKKMLKILRFD